MQATAHTVARLVGALVEMYAKKWNFFALFVLVFGFSIFILAQLDLLPSVPAIASVSAKSEEPTVLIHAPAVVEVPVKIEISSINLSASITNPDTTNIAALDTELLKGAVRYPTSAKLGENGNVVLFGHSSYLPVVGNPAYKTFNGIQKLAVGDVVTVYSGSTAYTYKVRSVAKESVDDNKPVPLSVSGKQLTLVTCNSFATKSDRFVIIADFVESHAIPL